MTQESIAKLIERYMDGDTTKSEEQALREYFNTAGDSIPDEWEPLRAIFAFVTTERKETATSQTAHQPERHKHQAGRTLHRVMMYVCPAAAAAMLVFGIVKHRPATAINHVVIDGIEYTDNDLAMQEAEQALKLVSSTDDDPFEALKMMSR